jgi:hypothetical protein
MGYMSALILLWYNLTSILGEVSFFSYSFASIGVLIGQTLVFPNLSRTSVMYFSWGYSACGMVSRDMHA